MCLSTTFKELKWRPKKNIALKTNFDTDIVFERAYIKVRSINMSKNAAQMNVDFFSEANGKVLDMRQYNFVATLDGNNPIAQAYDHLKTLPEFAGAVDC
jgi:hypothetical protein